MYIKMCVCVFVQQKCQEAKLLKRVTSKDCLLQRDTQRSKERGIVC